MLSVSALSLHELRGGERFVAEVAGAYCGRLRARLRPARALEVRAPLTPIPPPPHARTRRAPSRAPRAVPTPPRTAASRKPPRNGVLTFLNRPLAHHHYYHHRNVAAFARRSASHAPRAAADPVGCAPRAPSKCAHALGCARGCARSCAPRAPSRCAFDAVGCARGCASRAPSRRAPSPHPRGTIHLRISQAAARDVRLTANRHLAHNHRLVAAFARSHASYAPLLARVALSESTRMRCVCVACVQRGRGLASQDGHRARRRALRNAAPSRRW
jgi:hypothetical protein